LEIGDWIGLDWIGLDWIGLDWIGLDWIGLAVVCCSAPARISRNCSLALVALSSLSLLFFEVALLTKSSLVAVRSAVNRASIRSMAAALPKLLCLHGFTQNAGIFRAQCGGIEYDIELELENA